MEFKNKKLSVKTDDIFANDKLGRKQSVENLSLLLKNVSSPIVFSVNAPWGAGKTSFLNMLNASLLQAGRKTVYFSAWETDFASDPLLAFLGEMNLALSPLINGDEKKVKAWGKVKKAGVHILKRSIPVGVKLATAGIIDTDKIIEDEASKLAETFSKDVIDSYTKSKESIVEFKDNVKKVLSAEKGGVESLYVFVDELDRCRPTYAIELLERIKHLLDVEGLVFVLALDKVQLAHSVKAVYGADFDASGYLKRFIDIEFSLPEAPIGLFVDYLYEHFGFVEYFQIREKSPATNADGLALKDSLKLFAYNSNMSLRSIEQLFSKVNLILLMVKPNKFLYPDILIFLLVAKEVCGDDFSRFASGSTDGSKILDFLYLMIPSIESNSRYIRVDVEAMVVASSKEISKAWYDKMLRKFKDHSDNTSNDYAVRRYYGDVLELMQQYVHREFPMKLMLARIEMLDDFVFEL